MTRLRRTLLLSLFVIGGVVTAAGAWRSKPAVQCESTAVVANQNQKEKPKPKPKADADKETILRQAKAFLEAFNKRDAKAAAMYFAQDAEMVERDGDVLQSRKAIQAVFESNFKANPKGKISIAVDSLRRIAPTVIVEEGRLTSFPDGKTAAYESNYEVVHVKSGGQWQMAHVRTLEVETLSPHERLKELEWMVGYWVDEEDDSITETTCEWSKDKNWLLRKFTIKIEGQPAMSGVQRVGWDPLTKQFKSWVFDSEGGYAEALWSRVGDHWVTKARGVRPDGTVVTSTNQFSYLGKDRMRWVSVHRLAGNEHLPDVSITIVRRPPVPGGKKK